MISVDNFDVPVAEISVIAVHKPVVPAADCIIFDTVAGKNVDLHAIIGNKQVGTAFHDFVVGVVKQVVNIKPKMTGLAVIIGKTAFLEINRRLNIDVVVAEV